MVRMTKKEKSKQSRPGLLLLLLLLPATTLMNRLKYSYKFALILFLFLVPLTVTTYFFTAETNYDIQFATKEVLGSQYLTPLMQQQRNVSTLQVFLQSYSQSDAAMNSELEKRINEIERVFLELKNLGSVSGAQLKIETELNEFMKSWQPFNQVMKALPPHDYDKACEELIRKIQVFRRSVGDKSNLILDPDLDSYYLMDLVLLKFPEMRDLLRQSRVRVTKVFLKKRRLIEDRQELTRVLGLMEFTRHAIESSFKTAFNNNPSKNLEISLRPAFERFLVSEKRFIEAVRRVVYIDAIDRLSQQEFDELEASMSEAQITLVKRTSAELRKLIETRIQTQKRKRNGALMISFLVMALVLYLGLAFYVSLMRVVKLLGEASERMLRGGDESVAVELETKDEMAIVVKSFNLVAEGLRSNMSKLSANEKLLSSMLQALPVVVFCKNVNENFKWSMWNKKAEEVFGFKSKDCIGKTDYDFFPKDQADWFRKKDIEACKTTETIDIPEEIVLTKHGSATLHTQKIVVRNSKGEPSLLLGVAEDITERKKNEQIFLTLYKQLEGQKSALDQFAIVSEADAQGHITYANDLFCKVSQYSREELIGQDHRIVNSGYHPKSFFKEMWATIGSGKVWRGEVKNRAKDGSHYWVDTTIVPFLNKEGKPEKYLSIRVVITELKNSGKKLNQMADSIPGVVYQYSLDKNGVQKFNYVSGYAETLVGLTPQVLMSDFNSLWSLVLPEDIEGVVQSIQTSAETLKPWSFEFRIKDVHGKLKYIQGDSIPEKPQGDGTIVWNGVLSDVTPRKLLEQQLLQSQKMEAVGSLAGGIAHDFNNLLTVINGYSDLITAKLTPDDPMRPKIEEIRKAGGRAAGLTAQLLAFSRRQVVQKEIVDINAQIVDMDQMLRRLITEQIELVTLQANDLWRIEMDPNQFQQVVMNLVVNARDAMPQGGKITLETQNKILSKEYISDQVKIPAGKYVVLIVSDTGCGMSDEVKRRIFEPFFTTKEQGKGTGLGLATCYGIVQQANGYLYVHSVLNQGSSFKVYFPFIESKDVLPKGAAEVAAPRGTETILIVEDENGLRDFAAELLRSVGYEVLEAENGEDALRLLKESPTKKIHLVLTDVIMPRMGGKELVKQVKSLYPDMKILMMSGYTGSSSEDEGELGVPFLQKPFSLKQLSSKLRDVLEH